MQEKDYINFKNLLQYFISHLEWVANNNVNHIGYLQHIKPLIDTKNFKKTGQGYNGDNIQKQISAWDNFEGYQICINITYNQKIGYQSKFCYLNWIWTGINIIAEWQNKQIVGLYQELFIEKKKPEKSVWKSLGMSKSLKELGLFDNSNSVNSNLKSFYDNFRNALIEDELKLKTKKQMIQIEKHIDLLKYKKQIIFQGPPGTGKTRKAELIAKEMLGLPDIKDLENNNHYKMVQFHPSYTYEDFVRGIIATPNGNSVIYESANKILGKFAKDALDNYTNSKKSPELISKESWVSEKYELFKDSFRTILEDSSEVLIKDGIKPKIIAVEDDSLRVNRYSNENDSILVKDNDIILAYIGLELSPELIKIRENFNLSKSARSGMSYVYQNLVTKFKDFLVKNSYKYTPDLTFKTEQLRKYVLIIDEINRANLSSVLGELIYALEYRGKEVESMYDVDGSHKLILPPNLYIIGTMNTADRSVGHIDYAIRRRFAFVEILPEALSDNDELYFNLEGFNAVAALFNRENVSNEFEIKDVQIGHSYFIAKKSEAKNETERDEIFKMKMQYEVVPILEEYVKDGILINDFGGKPIKEYIGTLKS